MQLASQPYRRCDRGCVRSYLTEPTDREGQPIPGFFDPDGPFEMDALGHSRSFRSLYGADPKLRMGWIEVQQ